MVVEIFTTDGISFSAKSAKDEFGTSFANYTCEAKVIEKTNDYKFFNFFHFNF